MSGWMLGFFAFSGMVAWAAGLMLAMFKILDFVLGQGGLNAE